MKERKHSNKRRTLPEKSFSSSHITRPNETKGQSKISSAAVLRCSEPKNVISPRNAHRSTKCTQEEICEAIVRWSGNNEKIENLPVKRRKSIKKLRRSLSKTCVTASRRSSMRKSSSIEDTLFRKSISASKRSNIGSGSFSFEDSSMMDLMETDSRITVEISLFYLQQQLPPEFPIIILHHWYNKYKSLTTIQDILSKRGWQLSLKANQHNESAIPEYYFGSWSYDCWNVFAGTSTGSYITCHKQNRYYIMYKLASGKVVLDIMAKGPSITQSMINKYKLTSGIPRPTKRYTCQKCGTKSPCEIVPPHSLVFEPFPITFPSATP